MIFSVILLHCIHIPFFLLISFHPFYCYRAIHTYMLLCSISVHAPYLASHLHLPIVSADTFFVPLSFCIPISCMPMIMSMMLQCIMSPALSCLVNCETRNHSHYNNWHCTNIYYQSIQSTIQADTGWRYKYKKGRHRRGNVEIGIYHILWHDWWCI